MVVERMEDGGSGGEGGEEEVGWGWRKKRGGVVEERGGGRGREGEGEGEGGGVA